jgi:hypothetical protein
MKNNLILLLVFSMAWVFGSSATVKADTFVIPLDVNGFYSGGQEVNFELDLGTALTEVVSARFICQGSVTAGLDYWGAPLSDQFEARLLTGINYMYADGPLVGAGTWPDPEPFSCDSAFNPAFGATWDFLLDGHTAGCVLLNGVCGPISYPPQLNSCGTITSASIIIEAIPVPEPATILLLSLGGLALLRRHKM